MPLFRPLAGFSPSCCAVLVQIEHCAEDRIANTESRRTSSMKNNFFMKQIYEIKLLLYSFFLLVFFFLLRLISPSSSAQSLE